MGQFYAQGTDNIFKTCFSLIYSSATPQQSTIWPVEHKTSYFFVKFRWMIFNSRWKEYKVYNFSSFKVIAIPSLHKFHLFKVQLQLVFVNVRKCKCLKFYSTLMKFSGIFFKDFPARPRLDWKTPFFNKDLTRPRIHVLVFFISIGFVQSRKLILFWNKFVFLEITL